MNLERLLQNPAGSGWRQYGQIRIAIRAYANKILREMHDTLRKIELTVGRCKQWKQLDLKRRKMENYSYAKIDKELGALERGIRQQHKGRHRPIRGDILGDVRRTCQYMMDDLDSDIGIKPFRLFVSDFASNCVNKIGDELDRLDNELNNRKYSNKLCRLSIEAHILVDKPLTYVSLQMSEGSPLDWTEFWELLKPAHMKVRSMSFTLHGTNKIDTLERFLGLQFVDYNQFAPIMAAPAPQIAPVVPAVLSMASAPRHQVLVTSPPRPRRRSPPPRLRALPPRSKLASLPVVKTSTIAFANPLGARPRVPLSESVTRRYSLPRVSAPALEVPPIPHIIPPSVRRTSLRGPAAAVVTTGPSHTRRPVVVTAPAHQVQMVSAPTRASRVPRPRPVMVTTPQVEVVSASVAGPSRIPRPAARRLSSAGATGRLQR